MAGRPTVWLLALLGFAVALRAAEPPPAARAQQQRTNLAVFDQVWRAIERHYYDRTFHGLDWAAVGGRHRAAAARAATTEALYAAINAMLDELGDEHTHALTPREARARKAREGVLLGLRLRRLDDGTGRSLVLDVMPGGSAAEQGVRPGWILVAANDRPPDEVLGFDRLSEGQAVHCLFLDEADRPLRLTLTARRLDMRPVREARRLPDGILYLRFDKFDTPSARWLRRQLKTHRDTPGVILDLRTNPGGDAAALGRCLGEFFDYRAAMGTFITRRGRGRELRAWRWPLSARCRAPLAVLISENSASSAEIFAAVIRHHQRGIILGERTAGAVLAARFKRLRDGGLLEYSVLDYFAPDGSRLEKRGVTPDIPIRTTLADLRAGRDPVLAAAVTALTGQHAETLAATPLANPSADISSARAAGGG